MDLRDFQRPTQSCVTSLPVRHLWWKLSQQGQEEGHRHTTRFNSTVIQQQYLKHNKSVYFLNDRYLILVKDGPVELLPFLYLGSAFHSSRRETLTAAGITAVLNVSSTCPNFFEGEFQYLQLTVEDSLATDIRACFPTAIAFIGEILLKETLLLQVDVSLAFFRILQAKSPAPIIHVVVLWSHNVNRLLESNFILHKLQRFINVKLPRE